MKIKVKTKTKPKTKTKKGKQLVQLNESNWHDKLSDLLQTSKDEQLPQISHKATDNHLRQVQRNHQIEGLFEQIVSTLVNPIREMLSNSSPKVQEDGRLATIKLINQWVIRYNGIMGDEGGSR